MLEEKEENMATAGYLPAMAKTFPCTVVLKMLRGEISRLGKKKKMIAIACLRRRSAPTHKGLGFWSVEDEGSQGLFMDDLFSVWLGTST